MSVAGPEAAAPSEAAVGHEREVVVVSLERAKEHVARADRQWDRVALASWSPEDPESAVTWAFYAYENCVTALAELHGRSWTKRHWDKVQLARKLYQDGLASRDVGDELQALNELRKDVAYGEPGRDLDSRDLEALSSDLEAFIEEVRSRIRDAA